MIRFSKRHLALLAAIVALAAPLATPPAFAQDSGAVAVNTKDDSSLFRLAFSVRQVMGETVDQTNAAVAYSSCERCQTVAIAIQVLIVVGDPEVFTPENVAIAINENCTLCETLATAYQFVVGRAVPVRLTGEGRKRIAEIRRELQLLRNEDLSIEEVQARVDALAGELRDVLRTELVSRDRVEDDRDDEELQEEPQDEETEPLPPEDETRPEPTETQPTDTTGTETQPAQPGTGTTPTTP